MMSGFRAEQHFASGQVAKCITCEALAEDSWPPRWLLVPDGFYCPSCAFPDKTLAHKERTTEDDVAP